MILTIYVYISHNYSFNSKNTFFTKLAWNPYKQQYTSSENTIWLRCICDIPTLISWGFTKSSTDVMFVSCYRDPILVSWYTSHHHPFYLYHWFFLKLLLACLLQIIYQHTIMYVFCSTVEQIVSRRWWQ